MASGWKGIGRGQGPLLVEEDDDRLPENLGAGMEDTERERRYLPPAAGTETQGLRNLPCHAARPALGSFMRNRPTPQGGSGPKKGQKKKMNGYLLFALHKRKQIERQTGDKVDKPMDQILRMFDEEWRNLSEDEKAIWKEKAKGSEESGPSQGRGPPRTGGRGAANGGEMNQGDDDNDGWDPY